MTQGGSGAAQAHVTRVRWRSFDADRLASRHDQCRHGLGWHEGGSLTQESGRIKLVDDENKRGEEEWGKEKRKERRKRKRKRGERREKKERVFVLSGFQNPNIYPYRIFETSFCFVIFLTEISILNEYGTKSSFQTII